MAGDPQEPWLPDLCRLPRLAVMLGMAELVVVVLALAPDGGARWDLERFVTASGFSLWLALTASVLLCVSRRALSKLPPPIGTALALLGGALVAALGACMMYVIDSSLGYGLVPRDVSLARFAWGSAAVTMLIVAVVLRYLFINDGWAAQVRASARAEADALQARIKPHFLFNSMNTIAALTRSNPERAEQAVEDLADLFRASLNDANARIPLRDEFEIARTHQRIEQLRLGDRLQVHWDIDELPMHVQVPSLIVQPLLENAVYHGIEMLPQGGLVSIVGKLRDKLIVIEVRNPITVQTGYGERDGNRMALENIRQRLELAWPGHSRVEAFQQGTEFCARLLFPFDDSE
jgi:two-component system sensor histidine kinase AlgZ